MFSAIVQESVNVHIGYVEGTSLFGDCFLLLFVIDVLQVCFFAFMPTGVGQHPRVFGPLLLEGS